MHLNCSVHWEPSTPSALSTHCTTNLEHSHALSTQCRLTWQALALSPTDLLGTKVPVRALCVVLDYLLKSILIWVDGFSAGTLTVCNVFDELVMGVWGFLYPREADFPQGNFQWQWTAQEVLARVSFWDPANLPYSRKLCSIVGESQNRVQKHQNSQGQEPVDRNNVLILGTVRWVLHQVERGQRNHPASESKHTRGGRQVPVFCRSLL